MTGAAKELSVTPGAVSRQISKLQDVLSFDLFEGPRYACTTTADGQRLARTLTRALDEIDATLLAVDRGRDRLLDVACLSTFAVRWLVPRLHRFRAENPAITLRLSTDAWRSEQSVNRVDVSIMALLPGEAPGEKDSFLFAEELGPVLKPELMEQGGIVEPVDLFRLLRLTSKTRVDTWQIWQDGLDIRAPVSSERTEFDHLSIALEAAASGLGVCMSPRHLVEGDIASGRLVAPFGFHPSAYNYVLRAHGRRKRNAEAFIDWVRRDAATA